MDGALDLGGIRTGKRRDVQDTITAHIPYLGEQKKTSCETYANGNAKLKSFFSNIWL